MRRQAVDSHVEHPRLAQVAHGCQLRTAFDAFAVNAAQVDGRPLAAGNFALLRPVGLQVAHAAVFTPGPEFQALPHLHLAPQHRTRDYGAAPPAR